MPVDIPSKNQNVLLYSVVHQGFVAPGTRIHNDCLTAIINFKELKSFIEFSAIWLSDLQFIERIK